MSQWLRVIASVPRETIGFVGRVFNRWRSLPPDRRALPSPKLLLEAAAGSTLLPITHELRKKPRNRPTLRPKNDP